MTRLRQLAVREAPLGLALVVGLGFATLPYWANGRLIWVADYDELAFYLPVMAQAYPHHFWQLTDPATGGATYYQPLPVLPGNLLARLMCNDPWSVNFYHRLWGGVAVALAWYAVLRSRFGPKIAAALACILLADPGVLHGQLGYELVKKLMHPPPLAEWAPPTALSLTQWRILNPLLCWPWWLAFLLFVGRAAAQPSGPRCLAAGIAAGLLFYIYFYLWTTALAGLLLALLIDRSNWRMYLRVIGVAILIGWPAVWAATQFRQQFGSDWLLRTDKFLPVNRWDELLLPRVSLLLLGIGWLWVWLLKDRQGRWLAAVATAALVLMNHTLLTGLQIENFHWKYALGPALSLLVLYAAADGLRWLCSQRWYRYAGQATLAGAVFVVVAGGWLYHRAATRCAQTVHIQQRIDEFRWHVSPLPLPNNGCVAGDPEFQYLASTAFGLRPLAGYTAVLSPISEAELEERTALNAYLLGWSREQFAADQQEQLQTTKWGLEARSASARQQRLQACLDAWDRVGTEIENLLARYDVRVVARWQSDDVPLPGHWQLAGQTPRWTIWVRSP
jgi:hypothetical protein